MYHTLFDLFLKIEYPLDAFLSASNEIANDWVLKRQGEVFILNSMTRFFFQVVRVSVAEEI